MLYCLGEPNTNAYSDTVLCFDVGEYRHYDLKSIDGEVDSVDCWALTGLIWNRQGGFAAVTGTAITGVDQDGTDAYFISYDANLVQKAQHTPQYGIAIYAVLGNIIIPKDKLPIIAPGDMGRYKLEWGIGVSYREDIMVNASLFGPPGEDKPWLDWDLQDGQHPKSVVRYAPDALPFLKPLVGGY